MKLYIPHLRDKLQLTKPWTFHLHSEWRNKKMEAALGLTLSSSPTMRIPDPSGATEVYEEIDYSLPPKTTVRYPSYAGSWRIYQTVTRTRPVYITVPNPNPSYMPITLPKGTVLTVDRVYIRNGAPDFDSVTFRIDKSDLGLTAIRVDGKKTGVRFWAKLPDVNTMNFELVSLE